MVKAVVGANWGDEGKGKITDMLAEKADIIVRFQGGANAGHTIVNNYGKFALHTLPSGVFYNHTTSVIGNGVALDIPLLIKEIEQEDREIDLKNYVDPDTPEYEEMVGRIGRQLNFTTLQFQRLDDMIESVGIGRDKLCTYCWDGAQ